MGCLPTHHQIDERGEGSEKLFAWSLSRSTDKILQVLRAKALRATCRVVREGTYGLSHLLRYGGGRGRLFGGDGITVEGCGGGCFALRAAQVSSFRLAMDSSEQAKRTAPL